MNATAYTPLESLLLFQSLAVFGTEPNVFAKISNILKNNVLIQECDKYDAGRLSPDALRELYLQLLREEIHNELEVDVPGDSSPSRKRKIQAPPLPTITDAKKYNDKLPQLADRLYARYRDHMVRAIREDERRYELLSREIAEINRGEWDERLRQEQNRGQRTSSEDFRRPPSIPRSSAQPERPVSRDTEKAKVAATPSPAPSPRTETRPEGLSINDVLNSTEPPPIPAHVPEKDSVSRLKNGNHPLPPISHHRTASSERPHGPSPLQQNQRLPPPPDWKWENSYQAPPPPQHQAQPPPPHGYPPPYPPQQQQHQQQQPSQQYGQYPPRGSFSGAPPQSHSIPSSPHAPQHNPIVLPPINGRGPGSPANHLDQLAEVADQQYRAPQSQSPMVQHQTSGPPMPPHYATSAPQQPQYIPTANQPMPYQPQYGHPPPPPPPFRAPSHPSQTPPPPQWNQQPPNGYQQQQFPPQPPPQNNYYPAPPPPQQPAPMPQPQPQSHSRQGSFAARPELPQLQQHQYNSPYNPANLAAVKLAQPDLNSTPMAKPPLKDHLKESAPSTPAFRLQTLKTGKSTLWKVQATPGTPKPPGNVGKAGFLPESPAYEPLSPVLQPSLPAITSEPKQQTSQTAMKDKPARGRGRLPRGRACSDATEPGTPSRASNGAGSTIKKEGLQQQRLRDLAPASPENGPPTPSAKRSISATESSDEFAVPEPVASTSRKRKLSSPEAEREREPSKPATHVSWTRNFPKISASALERIGAHRTASTFALPIKDRDAPGYREAIRRPMDLKSIKAAITAGNRAGIAMLKEMEERGEEVDKNAMVVELPVTKELVPPRGIVNSRQLERELMLMFANAVMFNPDSERGINLSRRTRSGRREGGYAVDEDGVVKDARMMAQDVQIIINELRETERKRESESFRSSMAREVEPKDKGKSKSQEKEVEDNETEVEEGPAKKRKRTTKD